MSATCPACGSTSSSAQQVSIRSESQALRCCSHCRLRWFASPTWLDAAYADPIADIDVGLPSRCYELARVTEALIRASGLEQAQHLDYGGGYGLLTRLIRDRGLDMRHHEPYAPNLFAQGLEADPRREFGCVTLVEVFEHLTDPLALLRELSTAQLIVVSTVLVPEDLPDIAQWWYLLPDLGQHITFYTPAALRQLASRAGFQLTTDGVGLHVFSRRTLSRTARLILHKRRLAGPIGRTLRHRQGARTLAHDDAALAFAALRRASS